MSDKTMKMPPIARGMGRGPVGAVVEKPKDFKGSIKRLLSFLKPHRFKIICVIIFAILSTAFSIYSPKLTGKAITSLFESMVLKSQEVPNATVDYQYIGTIVIIMIILYVVSAVFNYLQQYIMAGVSQNTVYALRKKVSKKLAKLPLKYYDSNTKGEILSRITNDIETISTTLQQSLTQIITSVCTLVGIVIMMFTINWSITLIALVTIPLSLIVSMFVAKKSQKYFIAQQKSLGNMNGHVEEMYSGYNVVKAYGYEQKAIEKFEKINNELYNYGWKAQFVSGVIMPLLNFIGNLGYVAICIVGALFVANGSINVGDIQSLIAYVRQLTHPIVQTANIANILQSTVAAAERVFELLDEKEELPDVENAQTIKEPKGEVKLENVHFGYSEDKIIIHDLNMNVKSGQTIAIVGPTGAGKTTLVNLIMRFYELNSGKIFVDGVDITKLKRGELHELFGMVLQDTWLFNGTIRENIGYRKT